MPVPLVKSLAAKAGVSVRKAEELWDRAKKSAAEQGRADDYAYIAGILKRMLGLGESGAQASDPPSLFETKFPDQYVYIISRREFPFVIDSPEKLERWMVERGMEEGKFLVATQGDSYFVISTGTDWFRVLEMLFNTDGIQYESVRSDSALQLVEMWGDTSARRILMEAMPPNVRASLLMRYLQIEKQLRAAQRGQMDMNALALSLRQAIYTLLNWLAKKEPTPVDLQKSAGII